MSKIQRGRNSSGLTGLIDIPGFSAKFTVTVSRWQTRMNGATRERRGRGGGVYKTARWVMSSGTVACTAKIILQGWPMPDAWKGQTGTLTIQVASGKTATYPVLVLGAGFDYDADKMDTPNAVFNCELTGAPTYAGWSGTQPAATDPSKSNQEQWQGTSKLYDPSGLLTRATRLIDIWGTLTDSDSAEQTLIVTTISTTTPFTTPHDLKLRTRSFQKDALDGGTVVEQWGLTTPEEDAINSATVIINEANNVARRESTAAFGGPPAATLVGLVARHRTIKELNDSRVLEVQEYGERDFAQDITFPGTVTNDDASDLGDTKTITEIQEAAVPTPPAVPSGYKLRETRTVQHTDAGKYIHTFVYGRRNPEDDVEMGEASITDDPSNLGDSWIKVEVQSSSTPSAPSTPSGLKLRQTITTQIHGASTGEKWLHKFVYTRTTREDDAEFGASSIRDDPSNIADEQIIAELQSNVSPTPPSTPSGLVLYETVTKQMTDGLWLHVFVYRLMNRETAIEHRGTSATGTVAAPSVSTIIPVEIDVKTCLATDDVAELLAAEEPNYRNTAGFAALQVTKLSPLKYQLRVLRETDDLLIVETSGTTRIERLGTSPSGANCKLADVREIIAGEVQEVLFGTYTAFVSYKTVVIRRRKININNTSDMHNFSAYGSTNNATFLDYPQSTLMLVPESFRRNWNEEGVNWTQPWDIILRYRSIGWFDDGIVPVGRWMQVAYDAGFTPGATPALTEIRSGWAVTEALEVDFAPLIA